MQRWTPPLVFALSVALALFASHTPAAVHAATAATLPSGWNLVAGLFVLRGGYHAPTAAEQHELEAEVESEHDEDDRESSEFGVQSSGKSGEEAGRGGIHAGRGSESLPETVPTPHRSV